MIYFLNGNQEVIKIVRNSAILSAVQTQELPEDNSLLRDYLSVRLKNDERLFNAQYMAIKSYGGNRNAFDLYHIASEIVPDNATEFTGVQVAPYELEGVVIEDLRPQNRPLSQTMSQVLEGSDWRLGYVADNLPNVTTNFYYMSVKDALKKIQELANVEMLFKVEISGNSITDKWVEVYHQVGNRTMKRFNYGTNALSVVRESSHDELYTALIGRGKGEEVGETESGDATHGRKISFADVEWKKSAGNPVDKPKGQKYIELPNATAEYGIKLIDGRKVPRIGIVEFNDTDDPEVLIEQTYQELLVRARPKVLFKASVINTGDMLIGDTVTIHRRDLDFHYQARVRKVVRDRKNNNKTQVEIGDVVHTPSTKRQSNINSALNNVASDLDNVRGEVTEAKRSADGKNVNYYGNVEPDQKRVGDTWFRDHPSLTGESQMLVWNGEAWELVIDTSGTTKNAQAIEEATGIAEAAGDRAEEAYDRVQKAIDDAEDAYEYADSAIRAANGKNTVYRGTDKPTEGEENDIWFEYRVDNGKPVTRMHIHDGKDYRLRANDAASLGGTLDLAELNVINLNMDSATGGTLHLDRGITVENNGKDVLRVENGNVTMDVDNLMIESNISGEGFDEQVGTAIYQDNQAVGLIYKDENGEDKALINIGPDGPYLAGENIVLNGDTIVNGSFTVTDEIFAENMSIDKFTTGTLNAAEVNLINVNVENLVGNYGNFINLLLKSESSFTSIDGNGIRATHNDGTYTQLTDKGMRRYTSSDSRNYHYLIHATTFVYGDSSDSARWIQLPDDFKGKNFRVYLAVADSLNAMNYHRAIQRIVATGHPKHSIDHANARVPIIAYKSETLSDGVAPEITDVQGMLLAIY